MDLLVLGANDSGLWHIRRKENGGVGCGQNTAKKSTTPIFNDHRPLKLPKIVLFVFCRPHEHKAYYFGYSATINTYHSQVICLTSRCQECN